MGGNREGEYFRSSQAGCGIYKTADGGKTWNHMGLENTFTIARIVINFKNTNVVYAASGHEWTNNPDRGVYKTTDGGKTWNKVLFVNDMTGAIDLVMDPSDPNNLYATTWQRIRKKWNDPRTEPDYNADRVFEISQCRKTWEPINPGILEPKFRGRIGIDIARSNPKVVYAVDNYEKVADANDGESTDLTVGPPANDQRRNHLPFNRQGQTRIQMSGLSGEMKTQGVVPFCHLRMGVRANARGSER
ncbi:MAG: hypothetical protein MZV63_31910 [Marinilabiliales bacterium]|nr:hypothetical protein [Marinilabiliales bacterium]